jgi:hypothetical protein
MLSKDQLEIVKRSIPEFLLSKKEYTNGDIYRYYLENKNLFNNIIEKEITLEDIMLDFLGGLSKKYKDRLMLKGCLALKQHLSNISDMRYTRDIDLTMYELNDWFDLINSCCKLASENSRLSVQYNFIGRRGNSTHTSDSARIGYSYEDISGEFKIDMNIKLNEDDFREFVKIEDKEIAIYNIYGIIADKLRVLKTEKTCRRIKDLLDIYYIAISESFTIFELVSAINMRYPKLKEEGTDIYVLDINSYKNLEHAYEKYTMREVKKPDFVDVLEVVQSFVAPIYSFVLKGLAIDSVHKWDNKELAWKGL